MTKTAWLALAVWAFGGILGLAAEPLGEATFSLTDVARNRRVEVLLLYPQGEVPAPLVVFSPGFLFTGPAYRSWGELLATQGMATALVSYAYSLLNPSHRLLLDDLFFIVETLPQEARRRGILLDRDRVALVGHSLGGKLSVLAAAARPVRAVVALDPVDSGAPGTSDPVRFPSAIAAMPKVAAPVLLLGAEYGERPRFGMPCAPPEGNFRKFFEAALGPALEVTQLGAGHVDYLDNPDCGLLCAVCWPGLDPQGARSRAQAYTLLFLRAHLLENLSAYSQLLSLLAQHEGEGLARFRRKPENSRP